MKAQHVVVAMVIWGTLVLSSGTHATEPISERTLFHDIYKELVETNTSHSAGDTTLAAHRMEQRLRDAGFGATDA